MSKSIVGVVEENRTTWHIVGVGPTDHVTLCGLDGDDHIEGQFGTVEPKRGQKIDCAQCKQIWLGVRVMRLRYSDFAEKQP